MKLKICGIRRLEDINYINQYPPDYAGFICSQPFWRYVSPEQLKAFTQQLDPSITRVGVFVNPDLIEICAYAKYLDIIQLHGEESPELIQEIRKLAGLEIWKAARVKSREDIQKADVLPVDKLVLDSFSATSHGGTGVLAPWDIIQKNRPEHEIFLAGGISAENIREAAEAVHPFGMDVSSSVETDKCKDLEKIRILTKILRN